MRRTQFLLTVLCLGLGISISAVCYASAESNGKDQTAELHSKEPKDPDPVPPFRCTSSSDCGKGEFCTSETHECLKCIDCKGQLGRHQGPGTCGGTSDSCGGCIDQGSQLLDGICTSKPKTATGISGYSTLEKVVFMVFGILVGIGITYLFTCVTRKQGIPDKSGCFECLGPKKMD